MITLYAPAVLTTDVSEQGLQAGDIGTVIDILAGGEACIFEFMTQEGETIDVVMLEAEQVRPVDGDDIAHARRLSAPQPVGD